MDVDFQFRLYFPSRVNIVMNFLSKSGTSVRGFRLTPLDYWIIESRDNLCSAKNETDDERPSTRDVTIEAEKIARLSARLGFASSFRQSRFVIGRKFERRGLFASVTRPPWMIGWRRNIQQRLWQISIGYYAVLKRLKLAALTRPRDRGRCVSGKWKGKRNGGRVISKWKLTGTVGERIRERRGKPSWKWWKDFGVIEGIKGWKDG